MKIVIQNLHSAKNLGDHGIMAATLAGLNETYPDAQITVVANDPESWQVFPGVTVISSLLNWVADARLGNWRGSLWRTPPLLAWLLAYLVIYRLTGRSLPVWNKGRRQLLATYEQADLVLSCGGGNFYAEHGASPSFFWSLMTLWLPIGLGKPLVMLPQSVGPINGRLLRLLARPVFHKVEQIMLREPTSVQFMTQQLGYKRPLLLLPDQAFGLSRAEEVALPAAPETSWRLGVTLIDRSAHIARPHGQQLYETAVVEAIEQLHRQRETAVYLFVQCFGPSRSQDDRIVTRRVFDQLQQRGVPCFLIENLTDSASIKAAYACMDGMIATRMHTAIFALSSGVPTVVIGYQPKSLGMVRFLEVEAFYSDIGQITTDELMAQLETLHQQAAGIRAHLNGRMADLAQTTLHQWQAEITAVVNQHVQD